MAVNIAARRGAKYRRRKTGVVQKRRIEQEAGTIAGQARLAQSQPIQHCLVSEELFETGMGMVVLARGPTPTDVPMPVFLLNTFAPGVKNLYLRPVVGGEFGSQIAHMAITPPMVPADPAYARKLPHDMVAWSRALRIAPHRDYAKAEPIFGSVDTAAREAVFQFGHDGKPLFTGDISDMPLRLAG